MPRDTRTYNTWKQMVARCTRPSCDTYDRYGGRGIDVDPRWLNYETFVADMGVRPQGKTLDRKNNDKGYWPENCRWATPAEQGSNKRNNVRHALLGVTFTQSEWARLLGMGLSTFIYRMQHRKVSNDMDFLACFLKFDQLEELALRY